MNSLLKILRSSVISAIVAALTVPMVRADETRSDKVGSSGVLTEVQGIVATKLDELAREEGFEPVTGRTEISIRGDRALGFAISDDGSEGVFLVTASGDGTQGGLQSGAYTLKSVDDKHYEVLLDGEPFSTTLAVVDGDSGFVEAGLVDDLCGGTSGSLHDLCTRLVVCHYTDMWCPW